ncbi:hypothetical protein BJF84_21200 [Rhodococcus sp. CUA-806]|nr:hypothetical protein BJF84_21200 [Rhodococcus sp. CUA-806]
MILPVLLLDDGRYLTLSGEVLPAVQMVADARKRVFTTAAGARVERPPLYADREWDAQRELAPGPVVTLAESKVERWEKAAQRGGLVLAELTAVPA